jgi:hypothetical protein
MHRYTSQPLSGRSGWSRAAVLVLSAVLTFSLALVQGPSKLYAVVPASTQSPLVVGVPAAKTATPAPVAEVGSIGPSYPSTVTAPTGQKPQSKLWINDGSWWGSLFNSNSGRFEIYRFDWNSNQWVATNVAVDERPRSQMDVLWDGGKLYIASAVSEGTVGGDTGIRFSQYSYTPSNQSYVLDSSFPVLLGSGAIEAIVFDKDATGTLWATWTATNGVGGRKVYVTHSLSDARAWVTPYVLPGQGTTNLTNDDISALVSYQGHIGVMWSNQNDAAIYFASHEDGAADASWQQNPAVQGPRYADDHISLRSLQADPNGQLYAVVKTSLNDPYPNSSQPLILFLTLSSQGSWSRQTFGTAADDHTRPIVVLDSENRQAYVFASAPVVGGTIYYKTTRLARPSFVTGVGTPFIRLAGSSAVNNASSTKQAVNSFTGLLVIASDDAAHVYAYNRITIAASNPTANAGSLTTVQDQSAGGTLSGSDPEGDPLTFSIVANGALGSATITDPATGAFTYAPHSGAVGRDSFTFKVSDGTSDSNVATMSVTILPASGERGIWLMDEGSGTTILDGSGLANNGALQGSATWGTGYQGFSLHLAGVADYALVANDATLNISGPLTIAAWVKPERVATQYLVKKGILNGGSGGYELSLSSSGKAFVRLNQATSGNTYRIDSITSYPTSGTAWIHLAATYDGTTLRLYVNGVQEGAIAGPASIATNHGALGIGAQSDGASPLKGALDAVRLYARALSAAEIQALAAP